MDNTTAVDWSMFAMEAAEAAAETLAWSEGDYDADGTYQGNFLNDELSFEIKLLVLQDLVNFLSDQDIRDAIESTQATSTYIGHNFYLSANGHGAGFWDSGYETEAVLLHSRAKGYPRSLYRGDDEKVYTV